VKAMVGWLGLSLGGIARVTRARTRGQPMQSQGLKADGRP